MTLYELRKRYPRAEINLYFKEENGKYRQYMGIAYFNIEVEDFDYYNTSYDEWLNVYVKS